MRHLWFLPVVMVALASCGGQEVALNERIFAAETMELKGGGCFLYKLGSGESSGSTAGGVTEVLVVRQRMAGDTVTVSVEEGTQTLVQRTYDEGFFAEGRLDEFTATSSSGAEALLLRYWGSLDPNGTAGCTPLSENAPARATAP